MSWKVGRPNDRCGRSVGVADAAARSSAIAALRARVVPGADAAIRGGTIS